MNFLVFLLVLVIALGTLLFMLGYGALFFSAFSTGKKSSLLWLVVLGFSSVGAVIIGKPWYYALPFWLIPVLFAQVQLPASRTKMRAMLAFWLGVVLLAAGGGVLGYSVYQNADLSATMEKYRENKTQPAPAQ